MIWVCLVVTLITNGNRTVNDLNNRTVVSNTAYWILDWSLVSQPESHPVIDKCLCKQWYNWCVSGDTTNHHLCIEFEKMFLFEIKIVLIDDGRFVKLWHGPVVGSKWVWSIKENTTLATDMLLIITGTINTSCTIHGAGVSATLGLRVSPQSDVTILSPSCAPAVPHKPVVTQAGISSVSNQLDSMVESNVGAVAASLIDTSTVWSPSTGIDSDSKRSNLSQMLHDLFLVVGGESVIARETNSWWHSIVVIATVSCHTIASSVSRLNKS